MTEKVLNEDSPHYQAPRDYTRDPAFIQASPADKHKFLMAMDQEYAQDTPQNQQAFIRSMTPGNGTVPIASQSGRVYQGTPAEAALRDWSGPVAKVLASMLAAQGAGAAAGAAGGGGAAQATARMAGAGVPTGAAEPGSMGDKLVAGGKGALWAGGGELASRLANAVLTSPSVSRFGSRMAARPADPGTPPSNPITSATVMHDMGSQQPAGSAFAPRPILGPNGQAVSSVNAPVVDRNLQAAAPGTPTPIGPAKDLLVQRTPSPGTPATPENFLSRLLRSGAPAGAAQDENAQSGIMLGGKALWDALQGVGYKLGIGRDPNHTGGG